MSYGVLNRGVVEVAWNLSLSTEPPFPAALEFIPPFDVVGGTPGFAAFLNPTVLDSGEFGPGTIPIGAAFLLPARFPDYWVECSARGEVDSVSALGAWGFQLGILKNLDTFGGGSTRFGQLLVPNSGDGASDQVMSQTLQPFPLKLSAGDYLYPIAATNFPFADAPLLTSNAEFVVKLLARA